MTQDQIATMLEENAALHKKNAQTEADIRTTVTVLVGLGKTLNIDFNTFSGGGDIMQKLPAILGGITMRLGTGQLDTTKFSNLSAMMPVIEKYRPLVEDLIQNDGAE